MAYVDDCEVAVVSYYVAAFVSFAQSFAVFVRCSHYPLHLSGRNELDLPFLGLRYERGVTYVFALLVIGKEQGNVPIKVLLPLQHILDLVKAEEAPLWQSDLPSHLQ